MIGIVMFFVALFALLLGFPVAFTFGGIALIFGVWAEGIEMFAFMPYRIQSIMENTVLMAVPLFVFMGLVLQKTKLAEQLLESMGGRLFGGVRGGIAISTVLVGALLAASTGVVGASVVAMGLISLPVMLKYNYDKGLACGTICASGTLGQIIPPSIVLILLGDVLGVPVGDLFQAAIWPGITLVGAYVIYILIYAKLNPQAAQAIERDESISRKQEVLTALKAVLPPLALIIVVLGSIFAGIATPTESAALGGAGAIILSLLYKQFSWSMIYDASKETVKVTAMVFAILLGATAFSMAFTYTGGDYLVEEWMLELPGEKWGFLIITMVVILILGFFIDFVEICFIIVPIIAPVAELMGINMTWFAILIAMNLQTSFLTPPFGFSLFYLKGVAPAGGVTTRDIYKGVMPFIAIQIVVLASLLFFPGFYGMS
ncbi:LOW QUALITY PROTEIN: TRAP dicarboxylate transporter, DctM subunit, unknown substrate 6 [Vibrio sp. JCM 18904]|nr:LOW QUALITY PROTEIN: TRAP dicarboxylate transporter, DctM subunit, unknown substrate 6 [Vibrio sp. JCM 18904]